MREWMVRSLPYRVARRAYHFAYDHQRRSHWHSRRLVAAYLAAHSSPKLHIGCQENVLQGWLNTEFDDRAPMSVLFLDATAPFPIPSQSFDFVFSEHMIEHVPVSGAVNMLRECRRVLKPGGTIRLSTPQLEFLLELMTNPTEQHRDYAEFHYREYLEDPTLLTPAAVVNDYYRSWGHQFVYDEPSFRLLLEGAGFTDIRTMPLNASDEPQLSNLEHDARMPSGLLALTTMTFEAVKPA